MKILLTAPPLKKAVAALEALSRPSVVSRYRYLDFHKEVLRVRYAALERLSGSAGDQPPLLDMDEVGRRLAEEKPLVAPGELELEPSHLAKALEELCGLAGFDDEAESELESLRGLPDHDPDLAGLVRAIIVQDNAFFEAMAAETRMEASILAFVAEILAWPVLAHHAGRLPAQLETLRYSSRCPLCGNEPVMSVILEDGFRYLQCSLCPTLWEFRRIGCPFCLSELQNNFKFFYLEEDSPHRVHVCEACKRYIKGVDERKLKGRSLVPEVEVLSTHSLDEIALSRGYLRVPEDWGE